MDAIDHLLTRGVDTIYPTREALEKVLRSGKKIRLYQGFDPTGIQLHIGHAVGFRKLAEFQKLGHEVIFLIGDGTGQAGDPSGKTRSRDKYLSTEDLRKNGKDYIMQAAKIVNFDGDNPVKIVYNGDWLNKLGLKEILDIAGHFSLQQMLERDLYQERLKAGNDVSLREFMYPLLQGYDSVALQVDLELGGSDQMFNMLVGRKLESQILQKEKFVMTVPLLTDSNGTKIGKTEGNVIGLTDSPNDFYGKIMSLGDDAIIPCFTLLTDMSEDIITSMTAKMKAGENPMLFKKQLAFELTKQFNTESDAQKAQKEFESVHQQNNISGADATEIAADKKSIVDALASSGLSKSEAKRLIDQKAIDRDGKILSNTDIVIKGDIIKVGKKKFIKII